MTGAASRGPAAAPSLPARLDGVLCRLETGFVGAALLLATGILLVNVFLRYVLLAPISWAEELSLYLIVWIVFVGASVVVRTRGHIAVDLLPLMLSAANRRRLTLAVGALILVFLAVFFYYSGVHTLRVRGGGQVTPIMLAPMWLTYLAMPVGSALMFLRTCQILLRVLRSSEASSDASHIND